MAGFLSFPSATMAAAALAFVFVSLAVFAIMSVLDQRRHVEARYGLSEPGPTSAGEKAPLLFSKGRDAGAPGAKRKNKGRTALANLRRAGFVGRSAARQFETTRNALAVATAGLAYFTASYLLPAVSSWSLALIAGVAGFVGFQIPSWYLRYRIAELRREYSRGFPDFLDLLVVGAEAGSSISATLDRIAGEIALAYPNLAVQMRELNLELRAGGGLSDALENFAARLATDEAHGFAVVLKQAERYGSSIADSLRVYASELRSRRLVRAEEKAHTLPVKMLAPIGFFIFPITLLVVMAPALVQLKNSGFLGAR